MSPSQEAHQATFEEVLDVAEYFDGPRSGVALYRGVAHSFPSRMSDVYGADDEPDIFELVPVSDANALPRFAHATFEVAPDAPVVPSGQLRKLVVAWQEITDPLSNKSLERTREG